MIDHGPLDQPYVIRDRVRVLWLDVVRDGVVLERTDLTGRDEDAVYTVRTALGSLAYVGTEDLRADTGPRPAAGQLWRTRNGATDIVVVSVDAEGLVVEADDGHRYTLSDEHWVCVDDVYSLSGKD